MAIYHLHTEPASRASGKNALAMAAYRSGGRLIDDRTGEICDYRRKRGIIETCLIFPVGVSYDRQTLWNMAERAEKRRDSRIAREIRIALPHELDQQARRNLAEEFARQLVRKYQIAVDLSLHQPDKQGDIRNYHAHLLLTTRQITPEGLSDKSDLEKSDKALKQAGKLNGREQITAIREEWENLCNLALERGGHEARISAKSYKARNIDREPTIHLGPAATAMERRGIETEKGVINRIIRKRNRRITLQRRRKFLQREYDKIIHQPENERKLENEEIFEKELIQHESVSIIQETIKSPGESVLPEMNQPQEKIKQIDASELLNQIAIQNKMKEQEKVLSATDLLNQRKNLIKEKEKNLNQEHEQIKAEDLLKQYTQGNEQLEQQTQERQLTAKELLERHKEINNPGQERDKDGIER